MQFENYCLFCNSKVQVPDWKKIYVPVWREIQVPAWKDIEVCYI